MQIQCQFNGSTTNHKWKKIVANDMSDWQTDKTIVWWVDIKSKKCVFAPIGHEWVVESLINFDSLFFFAQSDRSRSIKVWKVSK